MAQELFFNDIFDYDQNVHNDTNGFVPKFPHRGAPETMLIGGSTRSYDSLHSYVMGMLTPFVVGGCGTLLKRFRDVTCNSSGVITTLRDIELGPRYGAMDVIGVGFIPGNNFTTDAMQFEVLQEDDTSATHPLELELDNPETRVDAAGTDSTGTRNLQFDQGKYYFYPLGANNASLPKTGLPPGGVNPVGCWPMARVDSFDIRATDMGESADAGRQGMPAVSNLITIGSFEEDLSVTPGGGQFDIGQRIKVVSSGMASGDNFYCIDLIGAVRV
jgi:hypothetical protein